MNETKTVEAVDLKGLEELLKNLGLFSDFTSKKITCKFCSDIVTKGNIGLIFPHKNKIWFSCSKLECVNKVSQIT